MPSLESRLIFWLRAAGLFLVMWGVPIAVVDRYGSDVPQADQWDAEGTRLYLPWQTHTLTWRAFFAPHNEHRIACTRVLALGLFLGNGQWDARLQCVVNAALHAAIGVMFFLWGAARLDRRWHRELWLGVVLAGTALPFAFENLLGGFNSQQYFLIGFSLAAIALLGAERPGTSRWWAGLACAVLAIFSMAAGLLAAATIGGVVLMTIRTRDDLRRHAATLAACGLVLALGVVLNHHAAHHDFMRAGSVAEFLAAFRRYVGWPFERMGWYRDLRMAVLPPLVWIPCLWLGGRIVRRPAQMRPVELIAFAVCGWALLQFAASAYARGAGAPWPAPRYLDNVLVGLAANVLALLIVPPRSLLPPWARRVLVGASTTGLLLAGVGLAVHLHHFVRHELPEQRATFERATRNTRVYLADGDPAHLREGEIPYPQTAGLVERLNHPEIRAILPVSLQPPPGRMGPLSRLAQAAAEAGLVIAGAGVVLLLAAQWRLRRNEVAPGFLAPHA